MKRSGDERVGGGQVGEGERSLDVADELYRRELSRERLSLRAVAEHDRAIELAKETTGVTQVVDKLGIAR